MEEKKERRRYIMKTKTITKTDNRKRKYISNRYFLLTLSHDSCGRPAIISDPRLEETLEVRIDKDEEGRELQEVENRATSYLLTLLQGKKDPTDTMVEYGLMKNKWDYRSNWQLVNETTLANLMEMMEKKGISAK